MWAISHIMSTTKEKRNKWGYNRFGERIPFPLFPTTHVT
jgi:hypothetical protein